MTEIEFFQSLSSLLVERQGKAVSIGRDTDLLSEGLVDSLTMFDVLLLGEELSGRSISVGNLDVEIFQNASRLYRTFFHEENVA